MAKLSRNMSFKNAEIDYKNMMLTEINKDDTEEFSIHDILKEWSGISGLTISIKQESGYSCETDGVIKAEDGE